MNAQSLSSHIKALEEKHQALEQKIAESLKMQAFDDMEMQALKQKKLSLKDEIVKFRAQLAENSAQ